MKNYTVVFGTGGDPRGYTGLSPTFLSFYNLATGTTNTPPSIAETISGKTGVYTFSYGTTQAISFLLDGATTGLGTGRYVTGQIDPADRSDEYGTSLMAFGTTLTAIGYSSLVYGSSLIAIGNTLTANIPAGLGTTLVTFANATTANFLNLGSTLVGVGTTLGLLGSSASSFGSTSIDPTTVFGFLMRTQELLEGDQVYTKGTGIFQLYNRGQSTLLRTKTISDAAANTTKTGL